MAQQFPLRLISFNIRYAATSLDINEKPWADRAPYVIDQLKDTIANAPFGAETVIGLQEVLRTQLHDICQGLGSDWAYIGVGRDDGGMEGEYNPIFYRKSALRLLHSDTKWLSPTPDVPSFGWNAGSRRMVNVGVFCHELTDKSFIAANTHLDNASAEARCEGVKVALDVVKHLQGAWGHLPVSLTGDFNSEPGEDAYNAVSHDGLLSDLYTLATDSQRCGHYNTFTGFDPVKVDQDKKRIDFIWLGTGDYGDWQQVRYEVLSNVKDEIYSSDHRAVVGDIKIMA